MLIPLRDDKQVRLNCTSVHSRLLGFPFPCPFIITCYFFPANTSHGCNPFDIISALYGFMKQSRTTGQYEPLYCRSPRMRILFMHQSKSCLQTCSCSEYFDIYPPPMSVPQEHEDIFSSVSTQRLANTKAHTSRFISANLPCNKFKNRLVNIMPYESTRVCLQPIRGVEGSDYINASFIDGYR